MNPFTESTVARPLASIEPRAIGLHSNRGAPATPSAPRGNTAGLLARVGVAAGLVLTASMVQAIDINLATQEQLRSVRGIGPKTAQIIIDERSRGGRFESFEDLSDRVKGIGPKKAAALQAAGVTLGGVGARSADVHESSKPPQGPRRTQAGAG
jgi:competence protein ComEA